jgi:hypothetical protein
LSGAPTFGQELVKTELLNDPGYLGIDGGDELCSIVVLLSLLAKNGDEEGVEIRRLRQNVGLAVVRFGNWRGTAIEV